MIGKISTAISIKHRILATFSIKKKSILTACMPLNTNHHRRYKNTDKYYGEFPRNIIIR
jgi:hypothetical protein